ncbi:MAG: transposase [Verrucomicrobia bacterium]|nr:transposase [Verrucomicrobiota bacterium]
MLKVSTRLKAVEIRAAKTKNSPVSVWDVPLAKLINGWKGKSSRRANQLLKRSGKFWQENYYDTLIRDEAHLKHAIRYTEQNSAKAFLAKATRDWPWSSAVIAMNTNASRGSAVHRRATFRSLPCAK